MFTPKNTHFETLIREKLKKQFFMQHLGMELTLIKAGYVEAEIETTEHLLQQNGFLHGGVTATLCDVSAGFAAFSLVAEGQVVVTADLHVSYLNPGDAPRYKAIGKVNKTGNMLHFCQSEVWGIYPDGSEKMIANCMATMATIQLPNK